nr:hypothetical protein Ade03nite_28760 [Actinoplanes derwentensis]
MGSTLIARSPKQLSTISAKMKKTKISSRAKVLGLCTTAGSANGATAGPAKGAPGSPPGSPPGGTGPAPDGTSAAPGGTGSRSRTAGNSLVGSWGTDPEGSAGEGDSAMP